jgi:CRISPR-associated protein Csx10
VTHTARKNAEMQVKLEFVLTFESDWHINAGFGAEGKADAVIERDPQDKPIISGATLKGVFRDALYDLAKNLNEDTDEITGILGSPGKDSHWKFSATASQKVVRESVMATGVRVDPRYRRAEDNKYFKRELGAADKFSFTVSGNIVLTQKELEQIQQEQKSVEDTIKDKALEEVEWLVAAASYIERLGGRRRRGNGACKIALKDEVSCGKILDCFEQRHFRNNPCIEFDWSKLLDEDRREEIKPYPNPSHRYRIILYTERPVIIAEKPEAGNVYQGQIVIPGSTLRGAFAEKAQPGDLQVNDPTKYNAFKRLFILGKLRFSHLNPLEVNDGVGIPVAQLPLGLQQVEGTPDCCFTSVFQKLSEHKGFSGWMRLQDGLQKASYATESHPHVRINPDLKRASDGDLYTYEAIPAGRYYTGELYLADDDWQNIGELLRINIDQPFELRIGKGRNRSYGQCRVIIVAMAEGDSPGWIHVPLEERLNTPKVKKDELYITLATDTIVQDTWGRFYGKFSKSSPDSDKNSDSEPAAQWIADIFHMKPEEIRIESPDVETDSQEKRPAQVVRTKFIESFDARSGLPRWRDKALVAGSTARLVFVNGKRPSIDVLKRLETEGIGLRRGEGYGRVIFNHPAHTKWAGFDKPITIPHKLSDEVNTTSEPLAETQETFTQRWKKTVNAKIQGIVSEPVCRSLARQLIEHPTIDELTETLKSEPRQKPEKSSYEEYKKAASIIVELLEQAKNEGERWRKAVVLLAEALMNNREKA